LLFCLLASSSLRITWAEKPAYIKEPHTVSFPEYGKEEVVPAHIIALSPASRVVRRAEEFTLFEVHEKKQE